MRTQRELLDQYVLPEPAWAELRDHAGERGIDFLSTAFDLASLDLVCELGVHALKLGSGELTNKPLLHRGGPPRPAGALLDRHGHRGRGGRRGGLARPQPRACC